MVRFTVEYIHTNKFSNTFFFNCWASTSFHRKPTNLAHIVNFKAYKNVNGFKFHITGNIYISNSVIADNYYGIRYGAWNTGVALENTKFIGLSQDVHLRLGKVCPYTKAGIYPSVNNFPSNQGQIELKNVDFTDFWCGSQTIELYEDPRLLDDMGDPVESTGVTITNSDESSKPIFGCDPIFQNVFMEDFDGSLGPSGKGAGFIIRNNDRMKAFLPTSSCEVLPYDEESCSSFCENVCLRLVHLQPFWESGTSDFVRLVLTNQDGRSHSYPMHSDGVAIVVLPAGQYHAEFFDGHDKLKEVDDVTVETFRIPRCENYVTASDFTFSTASPTQSPTEITDLPTLGPSETPSISILPTPSTFYVPLGTSSKCPYDSRRLFKTDTNTFFTVDDCYDRCYETPTCAYFTYQETSGVCMGCDPSSLPLSTHDGFDSYEMVVTQNFPFQLAGKNSKCPYDHSRLFKSSGDSLRACYELCHDRPGCEYFSYEASSKDCMGCSSNALPFDAGSGFDSYEMTVYQHFPYEVLSFDKKCNDRLLTMSTLTREDCYVRCRDESGCVSFTFGEGDKLPSAHKGLCMLCKPGDSLTSHSGFNTYDLTLNRGERLLRGSG